MHLEVLGKTDKDTASEEKTLSGLFANFNELSIHETSKNDVSDLGDAVSKISISESEDHERNQENETASEEKQTDSSEVNDDAKEIISKESEDPEASTADSESAEDTSSSNKQKTVEEAVIAQEEKSKDSTQEEASGDESDVEKDVKEKGEESGDERNEGKSEESGDERNEGKSEEFGDERNAEEKKEAGSDVGDKEKKREVMPKKKGRLLPRGLGMPNGQQYPYNPNHVMYNSYPSVETPAVAPIQYSSPMPEVMSPQQAISPHYTSMPVSPTPEYTNSNMYGLMQNCHPICYDNGVMFDTIGFSPDTPPSSVLDENEPFQQLSPLSYQEDPASPSMLNMMQPPSPTTNSPDEVLEAICKVEAEPYSSVAPEKLTVIKRNLEEMVVNCPYTEEVQSVRHDMLTLGLNYNYPLIPSPPPEEELSEKKLSSELKKYMNIAEYEKAKQKLRVITNEDITAKDQDGDTPCLVVVCRNQNTERFLENIVAVIKRVKPIDICCEMPVNNRTKTCVVCGKADRNEFYSPLAMVNNGDDNVLSSVIKSCHPELVVKYIVATICLRQSDMDRVFNSKHFPLYQAYKQQYPVLQRCLNHIQSGNVGWC